MQISLLILTHLTNLFKIAKRFQEALFFFYQEITDLMIKSLPKLIVLTRFPSTSLVSITITGDFRSQTINQKSPSVAAMGPWVRM